MDLSIVIVNYNVRYFLEQCLCAVEKAIEPIDAEVYVVDNASTDGSMDMVRKTFPWVKCIENKDNVGFSKANNQAIVESTGKYVLLLNPDTLVQEDTFVRSLAFMEEHPNAGGLGIRMIDGAGNFLPESKRGFPTPWVAFCKIVGLTSLFPRSAVFAQYYMGHLSAEENQEVDVLAGAYMLMPRAVLDDVGMLDEDFFMYGEDIDLSYRMQSAGYQNYYLAESQIIHYKGESTKKGSLNYVYVFYKAMAIFARKHFSGGEAGVYLIFIQLGIFMRALLAGVRRIFSSWGLPIADAAISYGALYYLKTYWESNHRFVEGGAYPDLYHLYVLPFYILIWMTFVFFQGGYDRPQLKTTALRGITYGTVLLLVGYGLLNESWRFSRALILMGAAAAMVVFTVNRLVADWFEKGKVLENNTTPRRFFVVGNRAEAERTRDIIRESGWSTSFIGWIPVNGEDNSDLNWNIGHWEDIEDLISVYRPNEIIFCSKDVTTESIIERMGDLMRFSIEVKILPPDGWFIIGSNSIHQQGELYAKEVRGLFTPQHRRQKRLFDVLSSLLLLLLFPLTILLFKSGSMFLRAAVQVLIGKRTWIGYRPPVESSLPNLPKGIFSLGEQLKEENRNRFNTSLNFLYTTQYKWSDDAAYLWNKLRGQ